MTVAEDVAAVALVLTGAAALAYVVAKKYYLLLYDYQFEPNVDEEGDPLPLGPQVDAVKERLRHILPPSMQGHLDLIRSADRTGNSEQPAGVEFVLTVHVGEPTSVGGKAVDVACTNMGGDELAHVHADLARPVSALWSAIRAEFPDEQIRLILPDGRALDDSGMSLADALAEREELLLPAGAPGGEGECEEEEEDEEEEEEEEGLCWSVPEEAPRRHLVTKASPANPNFNNLRFTPRQLLPRPWKAVFSGTAQEVFDIVFQRFLHMASAGILLSKGLAEYSQGGHASSPLAMVVCGLVQVLAIILTVFWQITRGLAYQDGYSPNLFGTCVGLDVNPSRPTLSEACERGWRALGAEGAWRKVVRAARKVARRGGIYTQEWLAYRTPMIKLEGTWATIATCVGFCHFAEDAAHRRAGGCPEYGASDLCSREAGLFGSAAGTLCAALHAGASAIPIVLPLGCLWLQAMDMATFSTFSNVADRTGDTYQWCKFEVFRQESKRDRPMTLKRQWKRYMIAYNLAMLSGVSVAAFCLGPLLTFMLFCPVLVAFFYTHGGNEFRQLGYRLYAEYLCVPACFLMPGGDRGHSPFGVVMRPVAPRRIYLAQCFFLVSTCSLSCLLHVNRGAGGRYGFVDGYNATEIMEENVLSAHDRHRDFQDFTLVNASLNWDRKGLATAPLVAYLSLVWALSSFVTVSGVVHMLISSLSEPNYMSGIDAVNVQYRSQQMDAADSLEGWANTQDRIWDKFDRAQEAHERRKQLLRGAHRPHRD